MSTSHADDTRETNSATGENPNATQGNNPEAKLFDPNAPYKHAPPKDGDPWTTILTPELEADTTRCNAWKDEVQNLLIFAGLFSAVVTAFVIESYKFLQPDHNAAVVGLLFYIANGLNSTSSLPPSVSPEMILTPFSQTPSAIRTNVFWFISLVLSLTTVLVGTIALQWLREHQSYGGYSNKEKLAMLHMRTKAIEAWFLPQVFAILPLLLQAALVLFLAGLIDFSLPLGLKPTIPVSIIVGLTLLFLAATTILPTLQGLSFYFGLYPLKTVPTPCPFKSPQSNALRTLFSIGLRMIIFRFFPPPSRTYNVSPNSGDSKWRIENPSLLVPDYLALYVRNIWYQQTWLTSDREWLALRDACHQRIFDNDPDLYAHRAWWEDTLPLSDVTQFLVEIINHSPGSKHTGSFLAALVHCFQELSESIWITNTDGDAYMPPRSDRRNHYFEHLHWNPSTSLSKFLLHGGDYKFERFGTPQTELKLYNYMEDKKPWLFIFSSDQTVIFLRVLLKNHTSPLLSRYLLELWSRVLHFSGHIAPLTPIIPNGSSIPIPEIITTSTMRFMEATFSKLDQRYSATANILDAVIKSANTHCISEDQSTGSLWRHPQMLEVLDNLACWTQDYLEWRWDQDDVTKQHGIADIDNQFANVFKFINDRLNEQRSDLPSGSQKRSLGIFFYVSIVLLGKLSVWCGGRYLFQKCDRNFVKVARSSLNALHETWSSGWKDELIEKQFQGSDYSRLLNPQIQRFSDRWWSIVFKYDIGRVVKQVQYIGGSAAEGSLSDALPYASSQSIAVSENTAGAIGSPLPSTTLPGTINHPANPYPRDGDIGHRLASSRHIPQFKVSGRGSASNLHNQTSDSTSHSPIHLPVVLDHPATRTEGPDIVNDFPLSRSLSLSNEPGEIRPLGDDRIAAETASPILIISQTLSPPGAPGSSGAVPQEVMLECMKAKISDDRPYDEPMLHDAVIRI